MSRVMSFHLSVPPVGLSRPQQALWWLKKSGLKPGLEWEKAHELCQQAEGDAEHDLVHALAHWIEGDVANADYWYRRAQSHRAETIEQEWGRIDEHLGASTARKDG